MIDDNPPEWTGDLDSIKAYLDWCVDAIQELRLHAKHPLYTILYSEKDGGYIATVSTLPHCSAFGNTATEAMLELKKMIKLIEQEKKQ